jgi:hypothetical protein
VEVELLAQDVDALELEALRSADGIVPKENAVDAAEQGSLEHLDGELSDLVVLVEEDGLEGLPVLDVATVEVVVLLPVFGDEGGNQRRHLGVARLCHY